MSGVDQPKRRQFLRQAARAAAGASSLGALPAGRPAWQQRDDQQREVWPCPSSPLQGAAFA
jgi:hypothetical protein